MPITAFIAFSTEKRESIKKAHPDWSFGDIGKEAGRLWKNLSEAEKGKYQSKAAAMTAASGKGDKKEKKGSKTEKAVKKGKK
jgi:hypothetical protein